MQRLNAEGHDESQYLPRGTPSVNPHRAQHKGITWEGSAIKVRDWMPDILFDRHRPEEKPYNDTCVNFYACMIQTQQTLRIGDIRGILFDKSDDVCTLPPTDTFLHIMRGLVKPESSMLLWVVCDDRNRGNILLARHLIGTIKHAIENAQNIIDNLVEQRKIQESSSGEVSPKTGRQ